MCALGKYRRTAPARAGLARFGAFPHWLRLPWSKKSHHGGAVRTIRADPTRRCENPEKRCGPPSGGRWTDSRSPSRWPGGGDYRSPRSGARRQRWRPAQAAHAAGYDANSAMETRW